MSTTGVPTDAGGWQSKGPDDGTLSFERVPWAKFFELLENEIFRDSEPRRDYVWRGQRRSDWSISSSLDRLFEKFNLLSNNGVELKRLALDHLTTFQYAARARRGPNPPELPTENDWWALGQHFGLATPLVDWTRSPFAAAYFAFEELTSDPTEYRVVYGLDRGAVERRNKELMEGPSFGGRPAVLEFFEPMTQENQRLVSQGGLFTRAPIGVPVERWISREFEGSELTVLLRIEIPDSDRLSCLRTLNRMNINHLSLFPDLTGASRATNLKLELGS